MIDKALIDALVTAELKVADAVWPIIDRMRSQGDCDVDIANTISRLSVDPEKFRKYVIVLMELGVK